MIPAALELHTESMALWDKAPTTRSFLEFARPGEAKGVPEVYDMIEAERVAPATLAKIEEISGDVVTAVEQIFQLVVKGVAS